MRAKPVGTSKYGTLFFASKLGGYNAVFGKIDELNKEVKESTLVYVDDDKRIRLGFRLGTLSYSSHNVLVISYEEALSDEVLREIKRRKLA